MKEDKKTAPFTAAEMDEINMVQSDVSYNPYTCGGCVEPRILHANKDGLFCSFCGYQQNWVHLNIFE